MEYQLHGINQIQVQAKIGLTFGHSLRSILRHDPDIVLVGEIRDLETAENAIQASLTGHLVFSTLHTNDSATAFTRMIDMGVEPFLVASTVEAVMAQRSGSHAVRTMSHVPTSRTAKICQPTSLTTSHERGTPLYKEVGCRACRQLGYTGRLGIYELLITTNRVRQLCHDRVGTWALKQAAQEEGMLTLREDGWIKVLNGRTTVEEVLRVTKGDLVK